MSPATLALAALVLAPLASETGLARAHAFAGELVRVDLAQRHLLVRVAGEPPRELLVRLADETRLTSAGRVVAPPDLRAGERVFVSCTDDERGAHTARAVKVGPSRHAAPGPSPSPR